MRPIKLKIDTKSQRYPIIIGSNLVSNLANIAKNNSVNFKKCLLIIDKNIRKEVIKNHLSFWLNWKHEILLNRIKNSRKRPLAFKATDNELIDLIKKRNNIYSKAMYEIKCDNLSKNEVINKILEIYETYKINN